MTRLFGHSQAVRAFTLIELLVVVSIVALLVAILLPALGRSKDQARLVTCLTRTRQIAMGSHLYAGEHGERLPYLTWDTQGRQITLLLPYIKSFDVYQCPTADDTESNGELWLTAGVPIFEAVVAGRSYYTDYKLNDLEALLNKRVSSVRSARWTVLALDIDFHWTRYRHGQGENLAFLDGHSEHMTREKYWYWIGNPWGLPPSADPFGNAPWYSWGQ